MESTVSKFKVGGRVRVKDGHYQGHPLGSRYNLPRDIGVIKSYVSDVSIRVQYGDWVSPDVSGNCFDLVDDGPVRTVTRKEIVPGTYGRVRVNDAGKAGLVGIWLDGHYFNPADLRAVAATVTALADALDEVA